MNKINGYSKEEAESLVKFICEGKAHGKTLTKIFEEYSRRSGRAKGSVRNYYYALLKTGGEEVEKLLKDTDLRALPVRPFTDEETDKILRAILKEKSRGISVRRAVLNLADGDDRLMLRYQNKYRNVLAKQPEKIEAIRRESGYNADYGADGYYADGARREIERRIDMLYGEIGASLKRENERLVATVKRLTDENRLLKLQVKNLQS